MKDSIPSKRDSVTTDRPEPFLDADEEFFAQVVILQDGLVAWATGKPFEEATCRRCRSQLLARHDLRHPVPPFVRKCRHLAQFWGWIKEEKPTYAERRRLIWDGCGPSDR